MSDNMLGVREVSGVVTDLLEKLGGENGKEWLVETKRFLRKEPCWSRPSKPFSIWMTINVGGVSKDELQRCLEDNDSYISFGARDIMGKPEFKTSVEPNKVPFVLIKVRDLGFTKEPTTQELFNGARLAPFNLALCEPEDGPHLRLALTDQSFNSWFYIAMKPITDTGGVPNVFRVVRDTDDSRWLRARSASPDGLWSLWEEVVFRSHKI